MASVEQRLAEVKARIADAAARSGRGADAVRLIVVTKTFAAEAIEPLLQAGHTDFGENRVQEAQGKWPRLRATYPGVRLHLIGPLQTNKVRDAVALFDAIHSLDRDKLAGELAREMARQVRSPNLFAQVNTSEEAQRSGVMPDKAAESVRRWRGDYGLAIAGLMCIPPLDADPAPHFDLLRRLARRLELPSLSMGMSGDFETAIEYGATHVRVGSAVLGERG